MVDITAVEDLMREHSILDGIMLIYEDVIHKLSQGHNNRLLKLVQVCATIVKHFIEDYHEQTEEKYVFPLLVKNNIEVELINELIQQHRISRLITRQIYHLAKDCKNVSKLIRYIQLFVKMYRVHENKEDLIVFQKFRKMLSEHEYKKMSELFENEEQSVLLPQYQYKEVKEMMDIMMKELGIFDLSKITKETIDNICI